MNQSKLTSVCFDEFMNEMRIEMAASQHSLGNILVQHNKKWRQLNKLNSACSFINQFEFEFIAGNELK